MFGYILFIIHISIHIKVYFVICVFSIAWSLISAFPLDIAVELLQKSAPSPIRKLHKKYAAHVAR